MHWYCFVLLPATVDMENWEWPVDYKSSTNRDERGMQQYGPVRSSMQQYGAVPGTWYLVPGTHEVDRRQ